MEEKKVRVGLFVLPGQENFLEDILNVPQCVINTKKEQINLKDSSVLVYVEWEDYR